MVYRGAVRLQEALLTRLGLSAEDAKGAARCDAGWRVCWAVLPACV